MAKEIILASGSPRRREILGRIVERFRVEKSDVEEIDHLDAADGSPEQFVAINARLKGEDVASRFPDAAVLSADTTVFLDDEVLNKPVDMDDARRMIRRLSSRAHRVLTGVFFASGVGRAPEVFVETSEVRFKELSDSAIDRYFSLVNPLDKAGAYGIQAGTDIILDRIDGSFTNVMGLPERRIRALFEQVLKVPTLPERR